MKKKNLLKRDDLTTGYPFPSLVQMKKDVLKNSNESEILRLAISSMDKFTVHNSNWELVHFLSNSIFISKVVKDNEQVKAIREIGAELLIKYREKYFERFHSQYKIEEEKEFIKIRFMILREILYFTIKKNFSGWRRFYTYLYSSLLQFEEYGIIGCYIREVDPSSKKFNGDFFARPAIEFITKLHEDQSQFLLLKSGPKAFSNYCIKHRLSFDSGYIFNVIAFLSQVYGISPSYKLFSSLFKERYESKFDERSKSMGIFKFDKYLLDYLKLNNMNISNEVLISLLDGYFQKRYREDGDIVKALIKDKTFEVINMDKKYKDQDWFIGRFKEYFKVLFMTKDISGLIEKNSNLKIFSISTKYGGYHHGVAIQVIAEKLSISRNIENYLREKLSVPLIGQGLWINEMLLLRKIQKITKHKVIHQWSPHWVGRFRFDIGIPSLKLCIEYNGVQHYKAVQYFGGDDGLLLTRKRDNKKRSLCKINGHKLIIIRFDHTEEEVDFILSENLLE